MDFPEFIPKTKYTFIVPSTHFSIYKDTFFFYKDTKCVKKHATLMSEFNVVNSAETTFGNIPWHKFNIELRERRLIKKSNMIQYGVYHKNIRILYRGKTSLNPGYVQDCSIGQQNYDHLIMIRRLRVGTIGRKGPWEWPNQNFDLIFSHYSAWDK
jgi:hypothetical protein